MLSAVSGSTLRKRCGSVSPSTPEGMAAKFCEKPANSSMPSTPGAQVKPVDSSGSDLESDFTCSLAPITRRRDWSTKNCFTPRRALNGPKRATSST
ncbi:hypothetical protein G6F24_017951 [Rhizopus arrhizus]|nr:hypothetical protein G6F24_017951 [Rhizopus arrhizus]